MRLIRHALVVAVFLTCGLAIPYGYYRYQQREYRNFRVVTPGRLYRSGQLTPTGLARIVEEYGIRTVITLREEDGRDDSHWEKQFCSERDIVFVRIPAREYWSRHGPAPARKSVSRFLQVLGDPDRYPPPILVHCFAGEHRTGAFCAIYRMEIEGWSNEEAMAEMKRCGYGNLEKEWDVRTFLRLYRPVMGKYAFVGRCDRGAEQSR
jgi:protein tyrosine/serine phosphatase